MEYSKRPVDSSRRFTGLAVVALLHLLVFYALVSGLGKKVVEVIKQTKAEVIEEIKEPPPPPEIVTPPPPKLDLPPPPYIPPPLVEISAPPPPNTITAAVADKPPAYDDKPRQPPPQTSTQPPATPTKSVSIGVACPTIVQPEMPAKAQKDGISGTVKVRIYVKGNAVVRVDYLSGPKIFERSVRTAIAQYVCLAPPEQELIAEQIFDFRNEE